MEEAAFYFTTFTWHRFTPNVLQPRRVGK
jgi:hypothetical protein